MHMHYTLAHIPYYGEDLPAKDAKDGKEGKK